MKITQRNLQVLMVGIAAIYFLWFGGRGALQASDDFVPPYSGARCLLQGCNPYDVSQLNRQYLLNGGAASGTVNWGHEMPVYPPSTLLTLSPLALLRFPAARLIWTLLNGFSFVAAVALIVSLCPESYGWLTCGLASLFLIAGRTPLRLGQPATLSISLAVIGAVFFVRGRYVPLAAALFLISLAVKPQIGGLIVVYFLLRGIHWKYAAVACGGAFLLLVMAVLILKGHPSNANWLSSLRGNVAATLAPGSINDPRPLNSNSNGDVNLQALTSVFLGDSTAFNAAAWGIFVALLTGWAMVVLREPDQGAGQHYAALGALTIISLFPVYHRFYDTRLLLLAIPALPFILARSRTLGVSIAALTVPAIVCFPYRIGLLLDRWGAREQILSHKILFLLLLRNQILALLLLFFLYLGAIAAVRSRAPTREFVAEQR